MTEMKNKSVLMITLGCFPLTPLPLPLHFLSLMHFELSPFSFLSPLHLCVSLCFRVKSLLSLFLCVLVSSSSLVSLSLLFFLKVGGNYISSGNQASQPWKSLTVGTGSPPRHSQGRKDSLFMGRGETRHIH